MRAAAHLAGQASDRVLHGGHRVTEDFQPLINPELRNGELVLALVNRLMPFRQSLREHRGLRASSSPSGILTCPSLRYPSLR